LDPGGRKECQIELGRHGRDDQPGGQRGRLAGGHRATIGASLAGDIEVEEASDYLYQNGIVAYPYSTEIPVAVLGAKYKWARGAGLL